MFYLNRHEELIYLIFFVLLCSQMELEITNGSKLFTNYFINEILQQKFKLMVDYSEYIYNLSMRVYPGWHTLKPRPGGA